MRVDLRTLQPNPMRDFNVDPIDQEQVEKLRKSIRNSGFWGGVVCRRLSDGVIQIGAGHHRVEAALAEGITEADLPVHDDRDDAWMLEVYVSENATQRGNNGVAEAGSVAGAIRWLAKAIITGGCPDFRTSSDLTRLRANLASQRGIGGRLIVELLANVPDLDRNMITQHLANLKASGDYSRIIGEVAAQVLRDPADVDVAKTAHQATEQAKEHYGTVAFDFAGVAQYLRNSHQIEVFRKLVTGKALKDALPIENQAPLAQHIVEVSKARNNAEVSGAFIRENVMSLVLSNQGTKRRLEREAQERLQEEDMRLRVHQYMHDFSRSFRLIAATGRKLERLAEEYPEAFVLLAEAGEFQRALRSAKQAIDLLHERVCP
jgi:VCBS repeat-containing protein